MMSTEIQSCYLGPHISPEQFIAEHTFIHLVNGQIDGYDGHRHYTLHSGESCIIRKNHLARYNKSKAAGTFAKVVVIFDEAFLRSYLETHHRSNQAYNSGGTFLRVRKDERLDGFIQSLKPYYRGGATIDAAVAESKRTELLELLLELHPGYSAILFDFGKPGKINLEAFMNRNYKFNVAIGRLAYLTGRSISAFKRDFEGIFHETPGRWLTKRRLQEAHFLMAQNNEKPGNIYLDLGFEDLSHFSFAFKKMFGIPPTELTGRQKD